MFTNDVGGTGRENIFEIISAHICEENEKKHVLYKLQVRHISWRRVDTKPAIIERRYTNFLKLYVDLCNEHNNLMSTISFPKKALIGNFDNKLIMARSTAFEALLKHVVLNDKLLNSQALLNFLQEKEITIAKQYMCNKEYSFALPLLVYNFTLLSNIFTDRSAPVLLALCRLVGCCYSIPGFPNAEKWTDLALHRYEAVSDSDLLTLYVPLLQVCIKVWWQNGRDKTALEQRLEEVKRSGFKVDENCSLLDAVAKLEIRLSEKC